MMLTKEQVLAADDATLNHWAAQYVMGLSLYNPPMWGKWQPTFRVDEDGRVYVNDHEPAIEESWYDTWTDYAPTENIVEAMDLADHLYNTERILTYTIARHSNIYDCTTLTSLRFTGGQVRAVRTHYTDPSLPRAITIAALLAVAAKGESE